MQQLQTTQIQPMMAISLRLDTETEQRLDYVARQTGRAKSYHLRALVKGGGAKTDTVMRYVDRVRPEANHVMHKQLAL